MTTATTATTDAATAFSHHMVLVNGVLLRVVVGGQGPALLLLHGWMGSWTSWRKAMPALAAHFTVIVPDARGCGDSAKPAAGCAARAACRVPSAGTATACSPAARSWRPRGGRCGRCRCWR